MIKFCLIAITAVYSVHAFHIMERQYERTALGDAIDKASLKLLKEAYASEHDKNIVSSPLAVMLLLSFYGKGAGEESSKEILKFLGGGNYSQFNNPYSRLSTSLSRINPDSFTLSNKMYVGNEYTLNDEFMFTSYWYRSEIDTIDFKDTKKAVEIINNWANQKTGGHIKSAVSEDAIDPDTAAALFNVIFFQGQWHVPFDVRDTEDKDFHVDSKTVVKKPTMRLEQPLYYTENKDLGARMVELPYIQYGFRMVVILPDKIDGLSSVLEKATERGLLDDVFRLQPTEGEVNLEMPKFEIKSALDLNNLLPKIGVSRIFDEPAPGIVKDNNVKLSKAFQQAFIKVDEEGATAGAFTGMMMVPMSSLYEPPTPVEFKVDRPFAYLILYKDKIIFIGTYTH